MAFSLRTVVDVLKSNNLLHELIAGDLWTTDCDNLRPQADLSFEDISYDTRKVSKDTLLFCKGNFTCNCQIPLGFSQLFYAFHIKSPILFF